MSKNHPVPDGNKRRRRRAEDSEDEQTKREPKHDPLSFLHVSYDELFEREWLPPVAEEEFHPILHPAITHPTQVSVLPPPGESADSVPPIYLMRNDNNRSASSSSSEGTTKKKRAYALMDRTSISLGHHGREWGDIVFAVVYKHLSKNVFQAPSEDEVTLVAIKRLNKQAVQDHLARGGQENPYKEIHRMQELGDNEHVLECIEALEDDKYLYIVTPRGNPGTLEDAIFSGDSNERLEPTKVKQYWKQILDILVYLGEHNICHRDISPDNFLFLNPNRLVLFDFALSVRIPINENDHVRHLMTGTGNFGTYSCMPPEIYCNRIYDGIGTDLYSATLILYFMLTKMVLYLKPDPNDISFRYYVIAKGLSSSPLNERSVEVLMNTFGSSVENQDQQHRLLQRSFAHLDLLSTDAMTILENIIRMNPKERWTLGQVLEAPFLQDE